MTENPEVGNQLRDFFVLCLSLCSIFCVLEYQKTFRVYRPYNLLGIFLLFCATLTAQNRRPVLSNADTFSKKRLLGLSAIYTVGYASSFSLLNNIWYAQYPRGRFQFFDDSKEWLGADKAGHAVTSYAETHYSYAMCRWAGLSERRAIWLGMATASFSQATLEVLDGFSTEWGFSASDIVANTAGCALFGIQQAYWKEQRFLLKISNTPRNYPNLPIYSVDNKHISSLEERAAALYGTLYAHTFFKDYNAAIYWFSANPAAFMPSARFPRWLNVAVGYSGENMYGGFKNTWDTEGGVKYALDAALYPRYRQFFLSFDIDLTRIKTKSRWLKTVAKTFNVIKIPAPAVEFNTLGKVKFYPIMF